MSVQPVLTALYTSLHVNFHYSQIQSKFITFCPKHYMSERGPLTPLADKRRYITLSAILLTN